MLYVTIAAFSVCKYVYCIIVYSVNEVFVHCSHLFPSIYTIHYVYYSMCMFSINTKCTKCRTLRTMSSCHGGQTLLRSMTNDNLQNSPTISRGKYSACMLSAGKWPTVCMAFSTEGLDLCNEAVS